MIAQAAGIYALYLLLFWLPSYLQETKHLTIMKTGLYTAVPWAIAVPVSIVHRHCQRSGVGHAHASGRRPARHGHPLRAAGGGDGVRAAYQQYQRDPGSVCVIALGHQCRDFAQLTLVTDLVHRARDVGKAISLTILAGNICGLLAPIVTGYVVAGLHSYDWALWIAGILLVIGAVALGTMTREVILPAEVPARRLSAAAPAFRL